MRFQVLDILPHIENPVTGRLVSPGRHPAFTGRQVPDAAGVIGSAAADHIAARL
jgi:hypothetical protein